MEEPGVHDQGEDVEEDLPGSGKPVLAGAELTGSVVDLHLDQSGALGGEENRDEPVHVGVEMNAVQGRFPVGLERTSIVMKSNACKVAQKPVCNPGRDLSGE